MRLNASADFIRAAIDAGRIVTPKVSIKKTASRSELLSSGSWDDVTDNVSKKNIPTFKNALEINLSQFSSSKITLTGLNIGFWETNYFDYDDFLEVKIEYILNNLTSESVQVYSGWIEKKKDSFRFKRFERPNNVTFEVWSYPDYADEVHAETVLRQYINDDVDGAGAEGLFLPHINGLYVTNANVASFVLRKGIHIISYQLDGSNKQAKLDDGDWVTLSTGSNTLINGNGDQKVTVYAQTGIPASGEYADDIIVDVQGNTLPKNWYYAVSARHLLKKLFEKAGITNVSFDSLEYPTRDGNPRVSFMELVADNESITASRTSVTYDGTYHWFGVDNKLYRRDANGDYTLMETLTSGYRIRRIIFNTRNGHLWLLVGSSSSVDMDTVYCYIIGSDTLSNGISVSTGPCRSASAEVIDYQHTSGYKYALLYTDQNNLTFDEVTISGSTISLSTVYTGQASPLITPLNALVYFKNGNEVYFAVSNDGDRKIRKLHVDSSGSWVDDGELAGESTNLGFTHAAYNNTDDRIYYFVPGGGIAAYQPGTNLSDTTVIYNVDACYSIISGGSNDVFVNYHHSPTSKNFLCKIYSGVAHEIFSGDAVDGVNPEPEPIRDIAVRFGGLTYNSNILWGVDVYGKFFKIATSISLFVDQADMEGLTVRGAIEKACRSFNLVYKISSTKSARVHRRSDEDGNVVTSGNTIALTSDNLKDITDDSFYGDAYDIIKVSNGQREVNYDGTIYDAVAFVTEKVHPIESDWIPGEILEDLAYNAYPFFSVPHKVFLGPSPTALMQYECLDGATIVHSGHMSLNEAGVIVDDSVDNVGRPEFKILVNA